MRTLQIGERITIAELVNKLQTLKFSEVTKVTFRELFNAHTNLDVNDVRDGWKDLFIDDYVFTISEINPDESIESGFRLNNSILLHKDVEVWLPCDLQGSNDIQADGTIKQIDNLFYLDVSYSVD